MEYETIVRCDGNWIRPTKPRATREEAESRFKAAVGTPGVTYVAVGEMNDGNYRIVQSWCP